MRALDGLQQNIQKEIRWLLQEKYNGKKTPEAEKDIARLEKGQHVDYVIGWVNFLGCKIDLSQKPLIPRPETEFWTEKVIEELRRQSSRNQAPYSSLRSSPRPNPMISRSLSPSLRALDIFAGSGCIGIAVLKHIPEVHVDFAEKEKKLLKQIEINVKLNKIDKSRYRILQSDVFSGVKQKYNYILANPPYVPEKNKILIQQSVIEQEPHQAVFGGKDGLLYIRKFLVEVKNYLLPRGVVYLEFDSGQEKEIEKLANEADATEISIEKDQYEKWRYARIVF